MYLISFYVPESHLTHVTKALFDKGAGNIGNYDSCAWYTEGTGQFRPLQGSSPYSGQQGRVETVKEIKVEMVCESSILEDVLRELVNAHPYEEPAYHAIEVTTLGNLL